MKIVFVCGSLEPGRDGVGDYTRRLAGALIRQGRQVRILALNDKGGHRGAEIKNQESDFTEVQDSEGTSLECLRLPLTLSWPERMRLALGWIKSFEPDCISIQYVPFAYHAKGLPLVAHRCLIRLSKMAKRRHLFFHEAWVGSYGAVPLKSRILRILQKQLISSFVRRLRSDVVQTSIPLYARNLSTICGEVGILPLFGNIRLDARDIDWFQALLKQEHLDSRKDWILGTFGAIPDNWNPAALLKGLVVEAKKRGCRIGFIFLGKNNHNLQTRIATLSVDCPEVTLVPLGEQSPGRVSAVLTGLNWSISKHEWGFHGRSGTDAAMFEHGTPVVSILPTLLDETPRPLLVRYEGNACDLLRVSRQPACDLLDQVAGMFLEKMDSFK